MTVLNEKVAYIKGHKNVILDVHQGTSALREFHRSKRITMAETSLAYYVAAGVVGRPCQTR